LISKLHIKYTPTFRSGEELLVQGDMIRVSLGRSLDE
jgi:hypothetical protein